MGAQSDLPLLVESAARLRLLLALLLVLALVLVLAPPFELPVSDWYPHDFLVSASSHSASLEVSSTSLLAAEKKRYSGGADSLRRQTTSTEIQITLDQVQSAA